MATSNWTGNVDGDLNNASNWDNGVPTGADNVYFELSYYTGNAAAPSSGTCVAAYISIGAPITNGIYTANYIENSGSINNGIFNGPVNNGFDINNGTFNGPVTSGSGGYIFGGTFNGAVTLSGEAVATFNGTVTVLQNGVLGGTCNGFVDASAADWTNNVGISTFYGLTVNFGIKLPGNTKTLYYQRGINGSGILGMI